MLNKIERGTQMGVSKKFQKGQKYFWYEYAIQKKENIYKYLSLEDVKNNFPGKYGIRFEEIHPLKGERIFNVDLYR